MNRTSFIECEATLYMLPLDCSVLVHCSGHVCFAYTMSPKTADHSALRFVSARAMRYISTAVILSSSSDRCHVAQGRQCLMHHIRVVLYMVIPCRKCACAEELAHASDMESVHEHRCSSPIARIRKASSSECCCMHAGHHLSLSWSKPKSRLAVLWMMICVLPSAASVRSLRS
jgi:hypothetical protein